MSVLTFLYINRSEMNFTFIFIPTFWFLILLQLRTCKTQDNVYMYQGPDGCHKVVAAEQTCYHVPLWILFFLLMLVSVSFLLLLGFVKGLIGLYICAPVGMWGIGTLIDLPRPLESYQEPDLAHLPVQYDVTGWPIHPETGERSVRAVTVKTEMYLNIIFFLTYPLVIIVTICSSCCFRETENGDDECYKCVNTIVFADCGDEKHKKVRSKKKKKRICRKDIYDDDDSAEDKDTQYVLCQMERSQQSLKEWE